MASAASIGEARVDVVAVTDKLESGLKKAEAATQRFDQNMNTRVGKRASVVMGEINGLNAKIATLQSQLTQAGQKAATFENKMQSAEVSVRRFGESQSRAGAAGAAAGVALGTFIGILGTEAASILTRAASDGLKFAASLSNLSSELGMTAEQLQVYLFAGRQVGVTNEQTIVGFRFLQKVMGEAASGSEHDAKVMKLVGISLEDIRSGSVTAGKAVPIIADALKRITNDAQRSAVELAIFGRTGQQLDSLLRQGSEGINNLAKAAKELGIVLSDDDIQNARETAAKLDDVKTVLEANMARTITQNSTAIIGLADSLGKLTGQLINFLASNPGEVVKWLTLIGGAYVGMRVAGLPGALIGGAVGYAGGAVIEAGINQRTRDANMDPKFRKQEVERAAAALSAAKRDTSSGRIRVSDPSEEMVQSRPISHSVDNARTELVRQLQLEKKALQAAKPTSPPSGKPDPKFQAQLDSLFSPKGPKGSGGSKGPADRTDQNEHAYQQQLERNQQEYLRLQEELATNLDEIANFQLQEIDLKQRGRDEDIAYMQARHQIGEKQADQLTLENKRNADLERDLVRRETQEKKDEAALSITEAGLKTDLEIEKAKESAARSQADRRDIMLREVDIEFQLERLGLEAIIHSKTASDAEKEIAKIRLDRLAELKGQAVASVERETMGPIEDYLSKLPQSMREVSEAIDQYILSKYEELNQRTREFADNFAGAFGNAAAQLAQFKSPLEVLKGLLSDLANLFTQTFIQQPITDWMRKNVAGGVAEKLVGGTASPIDGMTQKAFNAALHQSTWSVNRLADAAMAAANALQATATGGIVPLGTSASATALEFSSVNPQVDQFGSGLMQVLSGLGGAFGGGGGGGGILGTILKVASVFASGIHGGGNINPLGGGGNVYGVSSATPDVGIYAAGGWIGGKGTGTSDSNWIKGSRGEFMVNEREARRNPRLLEMINDGKLPTYFATLMASGKLGDKGGPTINMGGIHITPTGNPDYDRQTIRQARREVASGVGDALRVGYK